MKTKAFIFFFLLISVLNPQAQSAFQLVVKGKGQPILLFPGFIFGYAVTNCFILLRVNTTYALGLILMGTIF